MNPKELVYTKKDLHFKKDDVIFKEQDEGKEMYFIESGEIKIAKTIGKINVNIAVLYPGTFFGEMALITDNRRVASAIAVTDCNLRVMDKEAFMSNITNNEKFVKNLLVMLAERLEDANTNFTDLYKIITKSTISSTL